MKCLLPLAMSVAMLGTALACASTESGAKLLNVDRTGLALDGYDPVTYFPEGGAEPRRGRTELQIAHAGANYRFANPENLARFAANPERYVPAYGGWCAWAMARGQRVDVDPRSYLIEDDRLLLFYDGFFADTRASWREASSPALGAEADSHWTAIVREASVSR